MDTKIKEDLIVLLFFIVIMVPAFLYALKARTRREEYIRKIAQEEAAKNNTVEPEQ